MITFRLDRDVEVALAQWRDHYAPEMTLSGAAHELLVRGLAAATEPEQLAAHAVARAEALAETRRWVHGKLRSFLNDLLEESTRKT